MAYFNITCDLTNENEFDYQPLWNELRRFGGVKYQDSAYLLDVNGSCEEVLDHFKRFMHEADRLMVIEFSREPAWTRAFQGTQAWIDARFP